MTLATVRRLAADIFGVGENKVRINPDNTKDAEGALTRSDVKSLIEKGVVTKLKPRGRDSTAKKKRVGHGHRRGTPVDPKVLWMQKVRAQRSFLRALVASGALNKEHKRSVYMKVKSGIFRNKKAMLLYLKDNKLVDQGFEPKKEQVKPKKSVQKHDPSRLNKPPTNASSAKEANPKQLETRNKVHASTSAQVQQSHTKSGGKN